MARRGKDDMPLRGHRVRQTQSTLRSDRCNMRSRANAKVYFSRFADIYRYLLSRLLLGRAEMRNL